MRGTLGERIKTMRESRGMTQVQLAAEMGVSRSAIGMYERDEREPDLDTIEALADIFNVPMSALTDRNENKPDLVAEPKIAELNHLFSLVSDDLQDTVLNLLRAFVKDHIEN